MNPTSELPGLDRLMEVCRRLDLGLKSSPPSRSPPKAGTLIEGSIFDPLLASVYARIGQATFAADAHAGIVLYCHDDHEKELEESNRWWSEAYGMQLAFPTFIFAVEPMLAYYYATVPGLADDQGNQPVVHVDVYEDPYAMPVASNVDRFFEAYSRYLEALVALPEGQERGISVLTFPWDVPEIIGRDGSLVKQIHEGRFDELMPGLEERGWARKVVNAGLSRM